MKRRVEITPRVGVIMGSDSNRPPLRAAARALKGFAVPYEVRLISGQHTQDLMFECSTAAQKRGLRAIFAREGGGVLRPGMQAATFNVGQIMALVRK